MEFHCFTCYLKQFSLEKILDEKFVEERKEEFYPSDEYGTGIGICQSCVNALIAVGVPVRFEIPAD